MPAPGRHPRRWGETQMTDLAFLGLTILAFAVVSLVAKGVERL
ncbi:hypothetical protein [Streptomyces palmae]|nr:hypothetical protein [Streptomyces palmae]